MNRTSSICLVTSLLLVQGCAVSTRIATEIPPGKDGNDLANSCGPAPELEPYVYRIPTFQAAVVLVEFDHLPTKETANVRVAKSSGIKELDESAVRTVAKWKCDLPPLLKNQTAHRVPFRFINPMNPPPPAKLSIAWAGTYTAKSSTRFENAASITGFSSTSYGVNYGEETNRVVAKLGASFGVWLKLESVAANDWAQYRYVWKFPPAGLVNPRTGLRYFSEEGRSVCGVGEKCLRGWHFVEEWELVPGTYTFELWQGDSFLDARSFEVRLD